MPFHNFFRYIDTFETIVKSSAPSFDHLDPDPDTSSVARIDAQSWEEHLYGGEGWA